MSTARDAKIDSRGEAMSDTLSPAIEKAIREFAFAQYGAGVWAETQSAWKAKEHAAEALAALCTEIGRATLTPEEANRGVELIEESLGDDILYSVEVSLLSKLRLRASSGEKP